MMKVLALEWACYNINAVVLKVALTEIGKQAWAGEKGETIK
jgi:glycerol dehydrogenase